MPSHQRQSFQCQVPPLLHHCQTGCLTCQSHIQRPLHCRSRRTQCSRCFRFLKCLRSSLSCLSDRRLHCSSWSWMLMTRQHCSSSGSTGFQRRCRSHRSSSWQKSLSCFQHSLEPRCWMSSMRTFHLNSSFYSSWRLIHPGSRWRFDLSSWWNRPRWWWMMSSMS